jgi:hypothetical protein
LVAAVIWLLCGGETTALWTVKRPGEVVPGQGRCVLELTPMTVSDGYQEIQAAIVVRADAVLIRTESPLDTSFADIGVQVDAQTFIPMDAVEDRKVAVFTTQYARLIAQFKQGRKVRVQLRFWPTWPETGTHAVTFSLAGFSKAYAAMLACRE